MSGRRKLLSRRWGLLPCRRGLLSLRRGLLSRRGKLLSSRGRMLSRWGVLLHGLLRGGARAVVPVAAWDLDTAEEVGLVDTKAAAAVATEVVVGRHSLPA